jgi:hypothetical protein
MQFQLIKYYYDNLKTA